MTLFHYTCEHAAPKIERNGVITPSAHRFLPQLGPVVWLTDLDVPARVALGLPPTQAGCDRVAWRAVVELEPGELVHRWASWARRNLPLQQRQAVETNCQGSLIAHWWIGLGAVPIVRIEPT